MAGSGADTQTQESATSAAQASAPVPDKTETVESIAQDITETVSPFVQFTTDTAERFSRQFSSFDGLTVLAVILGAALLALLLMRPVRRQVERHWPSGEGTGAFIANLRNVVNRITFPLLLVVMLWIAIPILRELGISNDMLRVVASMLQAWIVINLFSSFVHDPFWSRTFAAAAWLIAALYILRLLNPLIAILDSAGLALGQSHVTIYDAIKGVFLLVVLVGLASFFVRIVQGQLARSSSLSPSIRSLLSQTVRIVTFFMAVLLAFNMVGIDLTALAVFSGAVGVGIGIGLQSLVANLLSGITLHLEGSVKEGDFIELSSGVIGEVKQINTRATRITTNDFVDILVPNSEFVNGAVINWTLRDNFCRVRIPFGVAYGTDKDLVKKVVLEAAATVPHELEGQNARPADVWLVNFGESSLDFELVVWIGGAAVKRPEKVRADYNWAIETALSEHGIEIPFPQRDLHIRSGILGVDTSKREK